MALHQAHKPAGSGLVELPKSFIDEVRARTDVVQLVGAYVALKQQGDNHLGLCPFHGEKTPSFTVSYRKQFYHCFGCGKNGDAISFLMEHAAMNFREAVTELAEAAHLPMPTASGPAAPVADTGALYRANEVAAAFFRHCLNYHQPTKDYLRGRGLKSEAAERFVIGYAPGEEWNALKEAFPQDYPTNKVLVQTGLVIVKEDSGKRYDRFRARVMFGIRDARGRMLGFGGRTMDGSDPKYLNSSTSPIFDKGASLFGIFEAREAIRQTKQVLVVEGYMDCVGLSTAGIGQTVATMGTACTEHHLERLVALAPEVIFAFDGDAAGLKAAWRSLQTCLPFASDERSFRFLLLSGNKDPDEVVLEEGAKGFNDRIAAALPLSAFLISHLAAQNNDLRSAEDRALFSKQAMELITRLPPGKLAGFIRAEILKASQMSPQAVKALARPPVTGSGRNGTSPWPLLIKATRAQPATAARAAEGAIAAMPQDLQDAFFAQQWESFPPTQQDFWKALQEAMLKDGSQPDQETELATAQRDMLTNAGAIIAAQLVKEARQALKAAYRAGKVSDEDLIKSVQHPTERSTPAGS